VLTVAAFSRQVVLGRVGSQLILSSSLAIGLGMLKECRIESDGPGSRFTQPS
jgi:hypothetical protein